MNNKSFVLAFIFFFLLYVQNIKSQEYWGCYFQTESDPAQFKYLEKNQTRKLHEYLFTIGFQEEFQFLVPIDEYSKIIAIIGKAVNGGKFRSILLPKFYVDSLSVSNPKKNHLFELFHAYGHHLNKQGRRDSITKITYELQADRFVGYQFNRLKIIQDTSMLRLKIPELLHKEKRFGVGLRTKAFKKGWELYDKERIHFLEELQIKLLIENKVKADSLYKFAREEKLVNPKESALAFSNAYRYSNGKNLKALHGAFNLYAQLKNFDLAIVHGNEILKKGSGFLGEEEQLAFYLEMSKIYFQRNHCSEAIDFSDLATLINEENSSLLRHQTELLRVCSNFKNNIAHLQKRIAIEGATPELYFKLSEQYFDNQDRQKALQYLKRILYLKPNHVHARLLLSKLYFAEWDELVNILKNQEAYLNMIDFKRTLETKNELFKKAENTLKEGLKLDNKNKVLKQELKRIRKMERDVIIYWPNRTYYSID